MIFDRTQSDVDKAVELRKEKVQKFEELTDSEIEILEKGTITINTLNRIENKQSELKELLNGIGYWDNSILSKPWEYNDIFNKEDFQRIVDNTNILRESFFVYKNTPNTPKVSYYYEDINSLEKILFDIETMIADVESNYSECGDLECGEE